MSDSPLDPDTDPFKPPAIPTIVSCLHCGEEFDSYLIEWRGENSEKGSPMGFWCCRTPACDGKGFGFDTFPVDPDSRAERAQLLKSKEYAAIRQLIDAATERTGLIEGATPKKSGKFVVRLPRSLHAALEAEAKEEGVSLNQLVVTKLALRMARVTSSE